MKKLKLKDSKTSKKLNLMKINPNFNLIHLRFESALLILVLLVFSFCQIYAQGIPVYSISETPMLDNVDQVIPKPNLEGENKNMGAIPESSVVCSYTNNLDFSLTAVTGGLRCNGEGDAISFLQVYDLPTLGATTDLDVSSVDVILIGNPTPTNITVNVYGIGAAPSPGAGFNISDLTLLATNTFTVSTVIPFSTATLVSIPITTTIPAGTVIVIEVGIPDGSVNTIFAISDAGVVSGGESYFLGCDGIAPQPISLSSIGFDDVMFQLNVDCSGGCTVFNSCIDDLIGDVVALDLSDASESVLTRILLMAKDRVDKGSSIGAVNLLDRFKILVDIHVTNAADATALKNKADDLILIV